ncbi:unnamed protein product, partial [Mesorhabditis spiculigera]
MYKLLVAVAFLIALAMAQNPKLDYGMKKVVKPHDLLVDESDQAMDILEGEVEQEVHYKLELQPNGAMCGVCQMLFSELYEYIKTHEASIPDALNALCDQMFARHPSELEMCEMLVQTQMKRIIDLIEGGTQPDVVCNELDLCP